MYETLLWMVPVIMVLTEYVKKLSGWKNLAIQAVSWGIGVLLGLLVERSVDGVYLGLVAALVANGVFTMEMARTLLQKLPTLKGKEALLLLLLAVPTAQAQRFSLETGYQLQPVAGPYFMVRYNYPLAHVNVGQGAYLWVLPEMGVFTTSLYLRLQALLETPGWTLGTDFRWEGPLTLRLFLRTEF